MRVTKRDGSDEDVSFDKVLRRIRLLCDGLVGVDAHSITQKVCTRIYDGVKTSELDELAAQMCASLVTEHPDYGVLAARIIVSNHHKNTSPSFSETMGMLYNATDVHGKHNPLISDELWSMVQFHKEKLNSVIDYERDYKFDYFGFKTLERAYLMKVGGKTVERPQHMWMRVALGIHGTDLKDAIETYDMMSRKKFTHATPTLFNAGTKANANLASCFLMDMRDSIKGIFKTVTDCALISKVGGGIGIHIHDIRSRGSHIRGTNGQGSGIIPMLRVLNATACYVNQSGRRAGSIALYLEPWHADVETYLDIRKNHGNEEERCRDLFTALWIPDLFMRRVQENGEWSLMCPDECPGLAAVYGEEFDALYQKYESEGRYRKKIKAQNLWVEILKAQIEGGTPYLCYKDAVNKKTNQKNVGVIRSSNLCVAPDTAILTDKGYIAIKKLENETVRVWNGMQWSTTTVMKTGENQDMWEIGFSDGSQLTCTGYHKFYIQTKYYRSCDVDDVIKSKYSETVEARNLKPSMKLIKWELPVIHNSSKVLKYAYTVGVYCGDGTTGKSQGPRACMFKHKENSPFCKRHAYMVEVYGDQIMHSMCHSNSYEAVKKISLYGEKIDLLPYLDYRLSYENDGHVEVLLYHDIMDKFTVPHDYCMDSKLRWFEGLSDTDGTIVRNGNAIGLQIASVKKSFLDEVRLMLHTMGVHSKVSTMHKEGEYRLMPNGKGGKSEYYCQPVYRILIGIEGVGKLVDLGFSPKRLKIENVNFNVSSRLRNVTVTYIKKLDHKMDTYCFNEPLRHAGIFNGVLTGQCSEVVQYSDETEAATCNLASIALPNYIKDGVYDFEELHMAAQILTKNINKVIDRTYYPTPETEKSNRRHRPIGLGVQGLADTYAILRMPFDSPEAAELNKKIFATIYHGAVTASVAIAKKRQLLIEEYEAPDTTDERRGEIEKHLHRTPGELALTMYRGAYETFDGCPASQGQLQYDLWGVEPDSMWDWDTLKQEIAKYGMRNSLLLAPMPTASTSQILGNVEAFEPFTSNFFQRRTLAGEFTIINKYLIADLIAKNLWSPQIKNQILANGGSVQNIDGIPQDIKDLYKTSWEIKQKVLIDQAADRGVYVCQSQSLNLFVEDAEFTKLTNMHFYAWKRGLKTGIYYLRTRPKAKTMAFTLDPTANKSPKKPVQTAAPVETEQECLMCSA